MSNLKEELRRLVESGAESVAFSDTFMGDEGCRMLCDQLKENTRVRSLDLRGCNIRSEGAVALAGLISNNSTLTFLGLEWNGVGMIDSGFQTLCKAIARNQSLVEVDFRNNNIGPAGGAALAALLAQNRKLERVDLRWNNLGVNGGRELAAAMQDNTTLVGLELSGNKVLDDSLRAVERALRRNRSDDTQIANLSASADAEHEATPPPS
jgi:Ran GTPase-activating protein (RanGAP) involved in mRNA processing and transport